MKKPTKGPKPKRYAIRVTTYVDAEVLAEFDQLCLDSGISRALALRLAIKDAVSQGLVSKILPVRQKRKGTK